MHLLSHKCLPPCCLNSALLSAPIYLFVSVYTYTVPTFDWHLANLIRTWYPRSIPYPHSVSTAIPHDNSNNPAPHHRTSNLSRLILTTGAPAPLLRWGSLAIFPALPLSRVPKKIDS